MYTSQNVVFYRIHDLVDHEVKHTESNLSPANQNTPRIQDCRPRTGNQGRELMSPESARNEVETRMVVLLPLDDDDMETASGYCIVGPQICNLNKDDSDVMSEDVGISRETTASIISSCDLSEGEIDEDDSDKGQQEERNRLMDNNTDEDTTQDRAVEEGGICTAPPEPTSNNEEETKVEDGKNGSQIGATACCSVLISPTSQKDNIGGNCCPFPVNTTKGEDDCFSESTLIYNREDWLISQGERVLNRERNELFLRNEKSGPYVDVFVSK